MNLSQPADLQELRQLLADATSRQRPAPGIDLSRFNAILEYHPEDMTVTVQAGRTLGSLQRELAASGQWLPIDPPDADQLTIGDVIGGNTTGPRRCGHGTVRDYLLGIEVMLADGQVIKSGGKVVKNVAGYDLAKLFIGGRGTLGIVLSATFKLCPLPEAESFLQLEDNTIARLASIVDGILASKLSPVVFDLHRFPTSVAPSPFTLVLGFAGAREDVASQTQAAAEFGFREPSGLGYSEQFHALFEAAKCISVLPSKLFPAIDELKESPLVARVANGLVYHAGNTIARPASAPAATPPMSLIQRIKDAFDPNHIFPQILP